MNGNGTRQTSYSTSSRDSRYGAGLQAQIQPSAKVLLDGYRGSLVYDDYSHMSLVSIKFYKSGEMSLISVADQQAVFSEFNSAESK